MTIPGPLSTFQKKVLSENQSFLEEGVMITPPFQFSF